MNNLEKEAKQFMKWRNISTISATEYQKSACKTAIFPKELGVQYLALGLTGEAGEVANKVKKFIRDGATKDEYLAKRIEIGYEIGDVLWYCAVLAEELEMNLGHIMEKNLEKLADRHKRGKISGSGDNR